MFEVDSTAESGRCSMCVLLRIGQCAFVDGRSAYTAREAYLRFERAQ